MRIAIIDSRYARLVSGVCCVDFGHQVTRVENADKVAELGRGETPVFEPGRDALVAANAKAVRLDFTADLAAPVAADFFTVGPPSRCCKGHADPSSVYGAGREIAAELDPGRALPPRLRASGKGREELTTTCNQRADWQLLDNPLGRGYELVPNC
jgi:UDPglucose 6-dehydrogenase